MNQPVMGAVQNSQRTPPQHGQAGDPVKEEVPVVGGATPAAQIKPDYKDPFAQQSDMLEQRRDSADNIVKKAINNQADEMVDKANAALSGGIGGSGVNQAEFEIMEKITAEDLELAEQVVFKGFAEKVVTILNMPGHNFTICTTSAEDVSMIDEIIYDMLKAKERDDGDYDLPAQHVNTMRAALNIAIGFKGIDGKDYCDEPINQLMTIKRAIIKIKDLEYEGDMEQMEALSKSLKRALKYRAIRIRRLPTPVVDMLSTKKVEFDQIMYTIMTSEHIIPKSSGQSQGTPEQPSSTKDEGSSTDQ